MARSRTRWVLAGLMALAALGSVAAPAQADPPANPFAGSWSGTWSVAGEVKGTFDWTISDAGRISGTLTHVGHPDGDGGIVGRVDADGKLKFVGMVPDDVGGNEWGNGFPFRGMAVIDHDGRLVASVDGETPIQGSILAILERS